MAGRDASANLGGMLSQIGGAIGGMGQGAQGLMQPIKSVFRPQVDMNDPASLQRQSQFFGSIGDTQQQELFANQAIIADKAQKEEQALQGKALISKINAGMQNVMADPRLSTQQKQDTLAKLQVAADEAATRYRLDPTDTMNMGRKVRSAYNALEAQERNNEVLARSAARQAGLRDLFAAADSGDTARLESLKKKLRANDFSDVVREFETADLEYKNAVAKNKDLLSKTGPLTDEELDLAKQYGVNETTLAAWKQTPTLARTALMRLSETVEKAKFTAEAAGKLSYSVVKDYIPSVIKQIRSEGAEWLDFFDDDMQDLADRVLSDEQAVKEIAAAVQVAKATTPEEIRGVVLTELSRFEEGSIWQKYFGADTALESFLGKTTTETDEQGRTVDVTETITSVGGTPTSMRVKKVRKSAAPESTLEERQANAAALAAQLSIPR